MQRTLGHDKLARRIVPGHIVGVYIVRALLVVYRLQLEARMVVGQDVREPILRPVTRQVGKGARLVAAHMLQLLELFAEPEIGVGRHQSIVFSKVLDQNGPIRLDHAVRQRHVIVGSRLLRRLSDQPASLPHEDQRGED